MAAIILCKDLDTDGEGMVDGRVSMASIILYKELHTDGEEFLPNNWDASQIERNDGLGQRHVH